MAHVVGQVFGFPSLQRARKMNPAFYTQNQIPENPALGEAEAGIVIIG